MAEIDAPIVVVGANGLVGAAITRALSERGAAVRAVVRDRSAAPELPGVTELVGDFTEADVAVAAVRDAAAVITTVHPMASDRATQHRVGVEGTLHLARAAAAAGVARLIHISTAAVYERSPETGDVDESSALVGEDANDYGATKRDADLALATVDGLTRVLLRPPAILGPGPTSTWNVLRPAAMREDAQAREAIADQTFAWVHVNDLAALAADLATARIAAGADPTDGPVEGGCVALNVAAAPARQRDYFAAVTRAMDVDPVWVDAPAWTGRLITGRAAAWGWAPRVGLPEALAELVDGLG